MPTYRYFDENDHALERVCSIAEMTTFENRRYNCRECGLPWIRSYATGRHISFHEGFYEHISEKGEYISSMSDLKRIAKENGNYSQYAEDLGGAFRAKEGRWI